MTDQPQPRPRPGLVGRAWADLPLRAKGLVVVAIPLLALLLATVLFGMALAQDRRAQGAVLHTVEVERQIAQVRVLVQAGVTGYVLTGERRYLTAYEAARRDLPRSIAHLGELVSDNPAQADRLERVRAIAETRGRVIEALVANVRADRPPRSRVGLLDRSKETGDALIAQLQAMQDTEQRLLAGRQAQARRTRALTLGAIGLSVLLGVAGGVAAVLLFTSGVTRRAAQLGHNAERLARGRPLLPTSPGRDALGALAGDLERAAVLPGEREQALRQAQAMLEHIVAWSPMVMFRGLLGGRGERYVSGNVERILGYTQEQVLGAPRFWFDHLHPGDRDRFTEALQGAVAERAPQLEQEYRFLLQDGYRWLYGVTRLVYDDGGQLADTLGHAMDVTERRQADQAVREREATLQAVINASPDIIAILDAEGAIRSMSPAVQRILGRPSDERVGRGAFSSDIIHPDDLERFTAAQRRVLTGQAEHAAVRLRARHADGRWRTLDIHSRPLAAPAEVLLVARDVTDQAALEEELRLAKLAAEQANQAKSEYLSRMSHELRTPLNAILGFAQLLELDDLADEQRENLGHILSGARHLLALINEVLDIAAIEAGRLSLSLEPVALADVAAETVSLRGQPVQPAPGRAGPEPPAVGAADHGHAPQLGLDLAADHRPDLVLLDLHLPDMPGEAALRRLQTSPRTAGIPVVILSADARPGLIQRLLEQGARGFLTKPLDVRELLELLDAVAADREQAGRA